MLDIVKKTRVLTKKQIVHAYRSDWKPIYRITYEHSRKLFKVLNGEIETEAQFCNWIYERFGSGIYYFRLMKKGQKGFRSFLYVEIKEERFRRLKPMIRNIEREKYKMLSDIERLEIEKRDLSGEDREDKEDEIQYTKEDLEDLGERARKKTKYPYPYLSSAVPVYSWHGFEEIKTEETSIEEIQKII